MEWCMYVTKLNDQINLVNVNGYFLQLQINKAKISYMSGKSAILFICGRCESWLGGEDQPLISASLLP